MRLALLGGGSIARAVAQAIRDRVITGVDVVGVAGSATPPSARILETASLVEAPPVSAQDLEGLGAEWVLEAAGTRATLDHVPALLANGSNAIIMSVGAMLDPHMERAVTDARDVGRKVVLPSGAIGGLDAVAAMNALGGLTESSITSTKRPAGLRGAPYLEEHGIQLPDDTSITVFEGSARQAVVGFPANVNVAAALSLAGIGPDSTMVKIVSDPTVTRTRHLIQVSGNAGSASFEINAAPNPANPRSSYLAALSAIHAVGSVS